MKEKGWWKVGFMQYNPKRMSIFECLSIEEPLGYFGLFILHGRDLISLVDSAVRTNIVLLLQSLFVVRVRFFLPHADCSNMFLLSFLSKVLQLP